MPKPVIPPGLVQGTPTQVLLTGGYARNPLRPVIAGFVQVGSSSLTPPTVAPVLTVDLPSLGSNDISMSWTASDKTGSSGFGYDVYADASVIDTTTNLTFQDTFADGTYAFNIVPKNAAGDGPESNTENATVPGNYTPVLTGPPSATEDFTLSWDAYPGAAFYRLFGSTSDSGYTQIYTPATNSQLVDFGLGLSWWYVVADDSGSFTSNESNHLFVELPPPPTDSFYRRPDTTSLYLRPDGTSFYLRP